MATTITSWVPLVAPDVPGCPNPTVKTAILESVRNFCKETFLWYKQLPAIEILEDIAKYQLTCSDGDIVGIKSVKINDIGRDYQPTSLMGQDRKLILPFVPSDDSDAHVALTDLTFTKSTKTIKSAATSFVAEGFAVGDVITVTDSDDNNRQFTIAAISDDGATNNVLTVDETVIDEGAGTGSATLCIDGLVVWVYLRPLKTATSVEDFLYTDWEAPISDGARASLMKMRDVPWKDLQMSAYYQASYNRQVADARGKKFAGYSGRPLRVKMPRFV